MAVTLSTTSAALNLAAVASAIQKFEFGDVNGDPSANVNFVTGILSLGNYNLATAAVTPTASNPVEVAATRVWGGIVSGTAGSTETLDLAALPNGNPADSLGPIDLTGLKIQGMIMQADFDNTEVVTVTRGASNPYQLFGTASTDGIHVLPGGVFIGFFPENTGKSTGLADVAGAVKEIDFTTASADYDISVLLFAG